MLFLSKRFLRVSRIFRSQTRLYNDESKPDMSSYHTVFLGRFVKFAAQLEVRFPEIRVQTYLVCASPSGAAPFTVNKLTYSLLPIEKLLAQDACNRNRDVYSQEGTAMVTVTLRGAGEVR